MRDTKQRRLIAQQYFEASSVRIMPKGANHASEVQRAMCCLRIDRRYAT
jgi:hypothetical protein